MSKNVRSIEELNKLPDHALINRAELAALLGVSYWSVWNITSANRGNPDFPKEVHLTPRLYRYRMGDIKRYVQREVDRMRSVQDAA